MIGILFRILLSPIAYLIFVIIKIFKAIAYTGAGNLLFVVAAVCWKMQSQSPFDFILLIVGTMCIIFLLFYAFSSFISVFESIPLTFKWVIDGEAGEISRPGENITIKWKSVRDLAKGDWD